MNALEQNYVSTVYQTFLGVAKSKNVVVARNDLDALLNKHCDSQVVEELAQTILSDCAPLRSDNKRYQFTSSNREKLLKNVFDISYLNDPNAVIESAKKVDSGLDPYPKTKNVYRIIIPKMIAGFTESFVFKLAVSIAALYVAYITVEAAYDLSTDIVAAKLPFFINHTSIHVIHMGNALMDAIEYVFDHSLQILFCMWLARTVILAGPNVPYFTTALRTVNLWKLFNILCNSPQKCYHFFINTALDAAKFVWNQCNNMSSFFQEIARNSENERLTISKKKAYEVWKKIVDENGSLWDSDRTKSGINFIF